MSIHSTLKIGVFDSGFGGLTVLRELLRAIPAAHFLYVGDTARLPYGAKSHATIARYAVESAVFLESRGAQMLVIACNTATALALEDIRAAVRIPVVGVIQPGAHAAADAIRANQEKSAQEKAAVRLSVRAAEELERDSSHADVLVLATAATVQSHAYRGACAEVGLRATEKPCPLLVPLVEEGWIDHPVTLDVLRIYVSEALADCAPQVVLLGCTHYPLIASPIEHTLRMLGCSATVVDSAHATAAAVARELTIRNLFSAASHPSTFECFATDSIEKFQRLGSLFLSQPIEHIHLLDLGG